MKVVVVSPWFSEGMGYAENFLPKAFARLGHEVHLLTSDFQVYATSPDYDHIYRSKLGDRQVPQGVSSREGFTLHRLPGRIRRRMVHIPQLTDALHRLRPDLVYCFEIDCPTTVLVARVRKRVDYTILCESRLHASIFRPPMGVMRKFKWKLANRLIGTADVVKNVHRFYPLGLDVLTIITTYFGVPRDRCILSSLAVETDIFCLQENPELVQRTRSKLSLLATDFVCVYTGRLTPDKGPLLLARAVKLLRAQGHADVRGLFVGEGEDYYVKQITDCSGCATHPFVSPTDLAAIYHASDIGVWPRQESTSQLDAMACGLPIIINDSVQDPIRLGPGALAFKKDNVESLARRIIELKNADNRKFLGRTAAARMLAQCSWQEVARRRIADAIISPVS